MEQYHHSSPHYLIWSEFRSAAMNPSFRPPPPPPFFQEWPPRSYSCSFCRREFRSAQALGGHMNVHRRDRAKLKQSLPTPKPSDHESPRKLSWGSENDVVQDDDFVVQNDDVLVCKRHKLCSSEEIDLELRLGAPAVKLVRQI